MGKYDDIINIKRHIFKNHKPMPLINRAAQFFPFSALVGHDKALDEISKITYEKKYHSEDEWYLLNLKLKYIYKYLLNQLIEITYFKNDINNEKGSYYTCINFIKKISNENKTIIMKDDTIIPFDDIINIKNDILDSIFID